MDEKIQQESDIFRSIFRDLQKQKRKVRFSRENFEIFSRIIEFKKKNKLSVHKLSELLGVSPFQFYYFQGKFRTSLKAPIAIRMKRVKIIDTPQEEKKIQLKTPQGFEIEFYKVSDVIEFMKGFL